MSLSHLFSCETTWHGLISVGHLKLLYKKVGIELCVCKVGPHLMPLTFFRKTSTWMRRGTCVGYIPWMTTQSLQSQFQVWNPLEGVRIGCLEILPPVEERGEVVGVVVMVQDVASVEVGDTTLKKIHMSHLLMVVHKHPVMPSQKHKL